MDNEWDHIVSMSATFEDWEDGVIIGERTYHGEQAWLMLKSHGSLLGGAPKLKQLLEAKKSYKGKNPMGGRKCKFSQSREYRVRTKLEGSTIERYKSSRRVLLPSGIISVTIPWYGWEE